MSLKHYYRDIRNVIKYILYIKVITLNGLLLYYPYLRHSSEDKEELEIDITLDEEAGIVATAVIEVPLPKKVKVYIIKALRLNVYLGYKFNEIIKDIPNLINNLIYEEDKEYNVKKIKEIEELEFNIPNSTTDTHIRPSFITLGYYLQIVLTKVRRINYIDLSLDLPLIEEWFTNYRIAFAFIPLFNCNPTGRALGAGPSAGVQALGAGAGVLGRALGCRRWGAGAGVQALGCRRWVLGRQLSRQ
ncbi:hypothetical protein B0T20DRAFT_389584 [Sordaria brevicollis]|uniref:Uncharacterized protein n=1 Tax=Sordaria brevicollis TaxID=83679 RepID=A0AAE0PKH4_SORBR|nr:hypothetical protein B0T20DRAFT_389584 [Sordaria brevicollis]